MTLGLLALAGLLSPPAAEAGHAGFADCARSGNEHRARWHPAPTTEPWRWQLQGKVNTHVLPRSVIGRRYAGFENERWLDVAHFHRFERAMKQRFGMYAHRGFAAVEPDNVADWEKENRTAGCRWREERRSAGEGTVGRLHRRRQGRLRDRVRTEGRRNPHHCQAIDFSSIRKSYDLFARPWIPCRYLGPHH